MASPLTFKQSNDKRDQEIQALQQNSKKQLAELRGIQDSDRKNLQAIEVAF